MSKLLAKTKELLRSTPIAMEKIAVDTNIKYHTILRIKGTHPSIPAVDTIERLYEYLSGKQLEV